VDHKDLAEAVWTALDVARFFRAHRNWVYAQAARGVLPSIRVGGLLRFNPTQIRALVEVSEGAPQLLAKAR